MTDEDKKVIEGPFSLVYKDGSGTSAPSFTGTFTNMSGSSITFWGGEAEVIKFCHNGDVYVRGELMENNKQLLNAMKAWLSDCNLYKENNE